MSQSDLIDFIKTKKRAHLVGIGGVSMSTLAEMLINRQVPVTGSDSNLQSEAVISLCKKGVEILPGHMAENIEKVLPDFLIRTAAVHDDDPEIARARELHIPVFERAEAYGALMREYQNAVCFAGTHGKTTSTSMFICIAMAAGIDPSVMLGGTLPLIGGGCRVGKHDMFILEACEYRNSFLSFAPSVAVILDIDADHMDFFKDLDDISRSFRKFAELVPKETGKVVANIDDRNTVECLNGLDRDVITFGFSQKADVTCKDISFDKGIARFSLVIKGKKINEIKLLVPGRHNISNALSAAAAAYCCSIPTDAIKRGLESFSGVGRRFEYKGEYSGALIYDDYAHHPSELKALFDSAFQMGFKRIIAVFQPHTYSRTKAFYNDFIRELSRPDKLILADIYPARETDTLGMSSKEIAEKIENAEYIPDYDDIVAKLKVLASPGDLILTVGAGEMDRISSRLAREGKNK